MQAACAKVSTVSEFLDEAAERVSSLEAHLEEGEHERRQNEKETEETLVGLKASLAEKAERSVVIMCFCCHCCGQGGAFLWRCRAVDSVAEVLVFIVCVVAVLYMMLISLWLFKNLVCWCNGRSHCVCPCCFCWLWIASSRSRATFVRNGRVAAS